MLQHRRIRNFPSLPSHDEIPFRTDSDDPSKYMEHIMFRKIPKYSAKDRKSAISHQKIEANDADEHVMKALVKLANTVQECFGYEHQANYAQDYYSKLSAVRDSRERRVGIIRRDKMVEEIQTRSNMRNGKLIRYAQSTGNNIILKLPRNRSQSVNFYLNRLRKNRINANRAMVKSDGDDTALLECRFENAIQLQKEKDEKKLEMKRNKEKALAEERKRLKKENIENTIATIRNGMDKADSMFDSFITKNKW